MKTRNKLYLSEGPLSDKQTEGLVQRSYADGIELANDQAEPHGPSDNKTPESCRTNQESSSVLAPATLLGEFPEANGPHIIYHAKKGSTYKGTLLMETESQARDLYNSMSAEFRTVLRCAWGQALPRRIDGVYPHTDLEHNDPPAVQVTKENGSVVIREI